MVAKNGRNVQQAAFEYFVKREWQPLPLPAGEKGPKMKNWQSFSCQEGQIRELFSEEGNLGLLLGEPSGGLVDLDLDCPEAVRAAALLLPNTGAVFGRQSAPRSHFLFISSGAKNEKLQFQGETLAELRAGPGHQTMAPPSLHPSGELVRWEQEGEPGEVAPEELQQATRKVAAAALLGKFWRQGSRQDAALALAGGLLRGGWSEDKTSRFLSAVAAAAGDEEEVSRLKAVSYTAEKLRQGQETTGWPSLAALLGEEAVKKARSWLQVEQPQVAHFRRTDLGNAERLAHYHGDKIRFCWPRKSWLVWDGRRWAWDNRAEVRRLAKDTVRRIYQEAADPNLSTEDREALGKWAVQSELRSRVDSMVALAAAEEGVPVVPEELDADPYLLNCWNGTLDLRTGELREHNPADLITKLAPVNYKPEARSLLFEHFLVRVLPDAEIRSFVQRALGYSLTGSVEEEALFFAFGPSATGKSTLFSAVEAALGDYAAMADFETFLAKPATGGNPARADIARLHGRRFVASLEVEEGRRFAEGLVNQLTGGDVVTARFLYQESFEFIPTFKVWLAANNKPQVRGADGAIWRRVKLIPFNQVIPKEERNPKLKSELQSPENLEAVLTWLVEGCQDWQRWGLAPPPEVESLTEEYRREQDPIKDFLEDCCYTGPGARASNAALLREYQEWAKKNGERPIGRKKFEKILAERFEREQIPGEKNRRDWVGIGLLSNRGD